MSDEPYGIREGEIAVTLPDKFDASLYFIGRIRTPWQRRQDCPKNGRESDAVCTIEVDARWAQALTGVASCSHLVVLYWMDQARRDLVIQSPRHYNEPRGSFALRSPVRPNPIAMSVVRLLGIEGNKLSVTGLDCLFRRMQPPIGQEFLFQVRKRRPFHLIGLRPKPNLGLVAQTPGSFVTARRSLERVVNHIVRAV